MQRPITYRAFASSDAEQVADVALEAWNWTYADVFSPVFIEQFVATNYAPTRLRSLAPDVAAGRAAFELALVEDAVIGFCHLGPAAEGAELYRLYLRPAYVGRGIGAALLTRGETFLRARGFLAYRCFVHGANERGKRFYAQQGFRRVPLHDREEEWCLEKHLTTTEDAQPGNRPRTIS